MLLYSVRRVAIPTQGAYQGLAVACRHGTSPNRSFATSQRFAKDKSDALRILFCGSDDFSCESLKALHAEHRRNKALVESVEVMVLPPKRMGRGNKKLAQLPCKELAEELGLTIHERKTFRDWTLPEGTNLVVAVSFGLFVPPRILSSARYGGLNVHPSLLPHLRGPAPIHHAYLRGDQHTGVSLQTLDPTAFDHGTILAQTPAPGITMPEKQSFQDLKHYLAVGGARMLVQGLRDGVHVPPHKAAGWAPGPAEGEKLVHAPKTTKADLEIDWKAWKVDGIIRRLKVFGAAWSRAVVSSGKDKGASKRVLFIKAKAVKADAVAEIEAEERIIKFVDANEVESDVKTKVDATTGTCYFQDGEGSWIAMKKAKLEGSTGKEATAALKPFLRAPES
ncbi:hypothetical protein NLG97_g9369 [Lecanicillium saksenae]|uniref:Uncharacterized protein n=1 Tax=Lecanicillium saksenae TaxID=468837 RepID=A0ACC1QK59_9HYPO|nr:hypothetical protein NLG97_g9369 [Lecanicillium saksenae]